MCKNYGVKNATCAPPSSLLLIGWRRLVSGEKKRYQNDLQIENAGFIWLAGDNLAESARINIIYNITHSASPRARNQSHRCMHLNDLCYLSNAGFKRIKLCMDEICLMLEWDTLCFAILASHSLSASIHISHRIERCYYLCILFTNHCFGKPVRVINLVKC